LHLLENYEDPSRRAVLKTTGVFGEEVLCNFLESTTFSEQSSTVNFRTEIHV